ncbi:MAG: hypothetical protein ACE5O2_00290 [Armatimonadota bacterium]
MALQVCGDINSVAGPAVQPEFPITYPLSCILTCAAVLRDSPQRLSDEDIRQYGAIISKYAHSLKTTLLDGGKS